MLGSSFTGSQKDTGPKGAGEQTNIYTYICVYVYIYIVIMKKIVRDPAQNF